MLAEAGAGVNTAYGSALTRVIELGSARAVKALIANGADVNEVAKGGTPLHLAAKNRHPEVVKVLVASDADIDAKDNTGRTPLDWAIRNELAIAVEALAEAGARLETAYGLLC